MKSVLVVGKPNSGKSLLFNRLTGLNQKVANFPGVTVEVKSGSCGSIRLVDFPGAYSLSPLSQDESIAVNKFHESLRDHAVAGVLCVLDGTRLERSLVMGLQVQAAARQENKDFFVAINMMDDIHAAGAQIDIEGLQNELACKVFAISARTGMGLDALRAHLDIAATATPRTKARDTQATLTDEPEKDLTPQRARHLAQQYGPKADSILRRQNTLDRFFLSNIGGGLAFLLIMVFFFQAIFTWATPAMDLVEGMIGGLGSFVSARLPAGIAADFVTDALFGGFGSFLVFVPQIFVLTFIIGLLEDSGYLARAAVICHRPLSLFGLSGKSFVPLLSGHACAIPAIFAARTIESPRHRLLTILTIPLMSCSARLPVYGLFISALIPATTVFGGLLGLQGLAFFALYVLGIVSAMLVSGLLNKFLPQSTATSPFIIELPPYRLPSWRPLLQRSLSYSWAFITRAGGVIFAVSVIVWVLGYFPNGSGELGSSWLALLGQWLEPIFAPLGVDWKYGVAILASFVAREVFVGTLGTLFGIESADENTADVVSRIQESALPLATGLGLLIFYVIALQCASTLAVIRKETGSNKLPVLLFFAYGGLAYLAAIFTRLVAQAVVG